MELCSYSLWDDWASFEFVDLFIYVHQKIDVEFLIILLQIACWEDMQSKEEL